MAPGDNQPHKETRTNVARLAKVNRIARFDDLHLIERYATKFGLDPDWVYDNTSFGTIWNFLIMWHEFEEYQERFQEIWQGINAPIPKK